MTFGRLLVVSFIAAAFLAESSLALDAILSASSSSVGGGAASSSSSSSQDNNNDNNEWTLQGFNYFESLLGKQTDAAVFSVEQEQADQWTADLSGFWMGAICADDNDDNSEFSGALRNSNNDKQEESEEDDDDCLRLLFRITSKYGKVFLYSLDQGGSLIPATVVQYNPTTKTIAMMFSMIQGQFLAQYNDDGNTITGTWQQLGHSRPLNLQRSQPTQDLAVPFPFEFILQKIVTGDPSSLVGFWSGKYQGDTVVVEFEKMGDPNMVEPKLWANGLLPWPIGIRSLVVTDNSKKVKFVVDDVVSGATNAIFEGTIDGHTITGEVLEDDGQATRTPMIFTWSKEWPGIENADQGNEARDDSLMEE